MVISIISLAILIINQYFLCLNTDHGAITHRNGSWWSKTGVLSFLDFLISETPGLFVLGTEQPLLERGRS